jgi:signal transduction histidine kinase
MASSAQSTQQLAEFVASVSQCTTGAAAAQAAAERAAEALDAAVAAIIADGEFLAAVGYAAGAEPVEELRRIRPATADSRLNVPGAGWCAVAAASLAYPPGATLVVARPRGLTREETVLLGGMARVAAMRMTTLSALDHERAGREEVARLGREQAAMRRVAMLVARGEPPGVVFDAVAQEVGRLLPADITAIVRYKSGTVTGVAAWSATGEPVQAKTGVIRGGRNVTETVYRTGRPERLDSYEDASGDRAAAARDMGIRSSVGAPISVEGRLWGVMIAAATHGRRLPSAAEERLAGFTELVATAIGNAEAREELRRVADEQAALRRVATLVAQGVPSEAVFSAVTEEIARLLPADVTALGRYEPNGYFLQVGLWNTGAKPVPSARRERLGGRNVRTRVFETGQPARIDDFGDDSGPGAVGWRSLGLRSAVGAPVIVAGRLWGVLVVASTSEEALPADTEVRLAGFTELVATAIANAQAHAELTASRARIVTAADQTRRRIERDLHDGAQQRLVTLALQLRAAQAKVPPQLDRLNAELDGVAVGLSSTLDELREFARGIHPAILVKGGLALALKTLARRSPIRVTLDIRTHERLPGPVEVAAYYVISEALTNAAKHSKAVGVHVQVQVQVDATSGILRLDVRDDGVGGADPARGTGLIGIRDRVEAAGGTFRVTSPRGEGTHLLIELPVRPSNQPADVGLGEVFTFSSDLRDEGTPTI